MCFSRRQGHGYEVIFAHDIDAAADSYGIGIVPLRTRLIAMFFLSTKEDGAAGQGVSLPQEYSQRMTEA